MAFLFGKKDKTEKKNNIDDYIVNAKNTALIITEGIDKGNYLEMNNKLAELISASNVKSEFVFERVRNVQFVVRMILCIVLLIPCVGILCLSAFTSLYSDVFDSYAIVGAVLSMSIIIFNIVCILKTNSILQFSKRYDKYEKILKYKSVELIDDIAEYTKNTKEKVVSDLTKAIDIKLIPQGHFGNDNMIFMVSDRVFNTYKSKQSVYDRYYRQQAEERLRMRERSDEMSKIMDEGKRYLRKIHECNDIINDKRIGKQVDTIEQIVNSIFHEVDINPQYIDKLGLFTNYYLPTTEKLLDTYVSLDEKNVKSKSGLLAKKNIEDSLDMIVKSFENILDKFYKEIEKDVSVDIATMEQLMKLEGLIEE